MGCGREVVNVAYEITKNYEIDGLHVTSRVVSDEIKEGPNPVRVILIETSCNSERWGIRSQKHTSTVPVDFAVENSLDDTRRREAEILAAIERGKRPEENPSFIAVKLHGTAGMSINAIASVNLATGPALMSPAFIQLLKLEDSGKRYAQWTQCGTQEVPLYKLTIEFGAHRIDTFVAPVQATSMVTCVIGGDFFDKALADSPKLLYELISPTHVRALYNAARCKKNCVLIAGKYGEARQRLTSIKEAIAELGFVGLILDELYDIEEQSLPEKFVTYASICRFVIVDDIAPSGHLMELPICHERKFVTGLLRQEGKPSSAMAADAADETTFIREFHYDASGYVEAARRAALWADEEVNKRAKRLNRKYNRSPEKVLR